MSNFDSLIDGNNKIKYADLRDYIVNVPLVEFMKDVGMPFLVGSELFEGDLRRQSGGTDTSTMRFSMAEVAAAVSGDTQGVADDATSAGSAISRAVYVLKKSPNSSESRREVFSIGRASTNDITIADYVISKRHAAIHNVHGKFFVEDLGSTNGVKVDSMPIAVGEKVMLKAGAAISFGRFCFKFTQPIELYNKIRKEMMGR